MIVDRVARALLPPTVSDELVGELMPEYRRVARLVLAEIEKTHILVDRALLESKHDEAMR